MLMPHIRIYLHRAKNFIRLMRFHFHLHRRVIDPEIAIEPFDDRPQDFLRLAHGLLFHQNML